MKRTIASARQFMDGAAPSLNPEMWARMDGEVAEAERIAGVRAETFAGQKFAEATQLGTAVVTDVCGLRDRATALVAAAKAGDMSAADVNAQLIELRAEYRSLQAQTADVARAAEQIETVEADPTGWADNFAERFPHLQPDFTF